MADRTYGDLVLEALHDDFDATKYTTKANQAVNDGLREMARRVDLPLLDTTTTITTASGTSAYSVPNDLIRLKALTDSNARPLDELSSIDDFDSMPASAGAPSSFLLYGPNLLLWPTPNSVANLTLRYRRSATSLVNSADPASSTIPDEYAHLLVSFARARLFRFEDDAEMATYWQSEFERGVALLRGDVQARTRGLRRVGDSRLATRPTFRRP